MTFEIDYVCKKCGLETYVCQDYSGNISAAWQVVEKMREKGWFVEIGFSPLSGWYCEITDYGPSGDRTLHAIVASEDTAPTVICLAALKAVS
jgi:hypothetical protein